MKIQDEIGVRFADQQFEALYSQRGQPAETPWRLALVTLMQFMENLTDREAADEEYARRIYHKLDTVDLTPQEKRHILELLHVGVRVDLEKKIRLVGWFNPEEDIGLLSQQCRYRANPGSCRPLLRRSLLPDRPRRKRRRGLA